MASGPDTLTWSSRERDVFARLDDAGGAMITTVKQWAQINSGSHNMPGLERMRDVVADHFRGCLPDSVQDDGASSGVELVDLAPSQIIDPHGQLVERAHPQAVRVCVRPHAPIQIAMTGHYDTVFPADSAFQGCRDVDHDTVNGPGVADMKGGLLVLAAALAAFETHPDAGRVGYTALISPDEEIGNPASAPHLAQLGARAHMGMTYEPALENGGLAGARKGSGNFSVVVRGRAAHAGREHAKGRNAIAAAARMAAQLDDLNGRRDGVTVNVGHIAGGGPLNMVPDLAIVRFNVRVVDPDQADWIAAAVKQIVADADAGEGISAVPHGGFTRPPKPMSAQNAAVFGLTKAAGASLGVDVFWTDTGGVCEGNNLWAAGCANVDTLGVRGGRIHSHDEFVKLSSFTERAKLSAAMLMACARGDFDPRGLRSSGPSR